MKTHRITRRTDLSCLIAGRARFRNSTGSLQGGTVEAFARDCFGSTCGRLSGDDLAAWQRDRDRVEYVITSYATPIAWPLPNGGWHVVAQKFSVTTSCHQSQVARGLAGITG